MAAREASETTLASMIIEASFFILRLRLLSMCCRIAQMVIGQTIAVPLLPPLDKNCCNEVATRNSIAKKAGGSLPPAYIARVDREAARGRKRLREIHRGKRRGDGPASGTRR